MGKNRLKETKSQKNKENILKKKHCHTPAVYNGVRVDSKPGMLNYRNVYFG